ncbi:MAG TPA: hypothetical protein VNI54_06580 [Thermoanaerobaculia bacterium]|nr:hypothetical protein [Thermoanaerobaculia bacterium]
MRFVSPAAVVTASLLCFVAAAAPEPKPTATTSTQSTATQTAATTDTAASEPLNRIAADIEATKSEMTAIKDEVKKIAENTEKSLVEDFAANYAMNLFWQFFGFEKTPKSAVGLGVSALGLLLSIIRVAFFFRKRDSEPPRWLRGMMAGYWCLLVATLTAVTITGFFGDHTQVQEPIAKVEIHTIEVQLDRLTREVQALRNGGVVVQAGNAAPNQMLSDIAQVRRDTSKLLDKWTGWFVGVINLILIVAVGGIVIARTESINP